jgi:hypothetical protein
MEAVPAVTGHRKDPGTVGWLGWAGTWRMAAGTWHLALQRQVSTYIQVGRVQVGVDKTYVDKTYVDKTYAVI